MEMFLPHCVWANSTRITHRFNFIDGLTGQNQDSVFIGLNGHASVNQTGGGTARMSAELSSTDVPELVTFAPFMRSAEGIRVRCRQTAQPSAKTLLARDIHH